MPLPNPKFEGSSRSGSSSIRQGGQSHTRNTKDVAIGALVMALEVTRQASAPFPPLQGVVEGILLIKDVLEKVLSNADDINALSDYIEKLNSMIKTSMSEDYKSHPKLESRIEDLRRDVDSISKDIVALRSQSRITRVFTAEATSGKIQEHLRALMWTLHKFIVGGTIAIEMAVDELHVVVREGFEHMDVRFDGLEGKMTGLAQQVENRERRAELGDDYVPIPRYAASARFDYHSNRVACEEKTRLETLATVYHWIKPGDSRLTELSIDLIQQPTDRRVLWLDGPAGTGKSTIAQTTAEWCDAVKYLGASFFCARDSNECSNVQLVFPTIAYQLGLYSVDFRDRVADVLRADPDIQDSSVSRQLQKLIVEPLLAVKSSGAFPACAVIIDALDECKDDQATSVLLKALAYYVHDLDPLKFFITSRPVQRVTGGFGMIELKNHTQHLAMNSISEEIKTRDIRWYLEKQLADAAHRYDIQGSWPSKDEMAALVHQANGLFIFAATAVKFIQDPEDSDPEAQLKILLRSQLPTSPTLPYQSLDALYTEVLHTAFPKIEINRALKARLKIVLGSIVLVRDRLPSSWLDALLGLERDTVRKTLRRLHSLVIVPEHDSNTIRHIHPSFHDFLTDRSRCVDPNFVVHPRIQHSVLAQYCLRTLRNLRRDICRIGDPSKLNIEVPDLDSRVARHIPPHLQYACKHWTFHVANAEISEDIHELLKLFVAEHLLHWLEVLSLLGDIGAAIEGLPIARKVLQGLPLPTSDVLNLLYDCERIAREFFPCLSVSCLQVYSSAITFCPINVGFRKQYDHEGSNGATLLSGSQHTWSPCIRIMEGHSDKVQGVAFSPDGEHIVSCAEDGTIRLWDVKTGSHLHTFTGHFSGVRAVAFSPSGREIVSGSFDAIIIVWDLVTGGHLDMWIAHVSPVSAIAWSPGGKLVGSGSWDGTIIIWDVTTKIHEAVTIFRGHNRVVNSLVFSRHGSLVVSCDDDGKCAVWNLQDMSLTWSFLYEADVSSVFAFSVALSHDDRIVAIGYLDGVVALRNLGDGRCIRELRGRSGGIRSVDFSRDGQILVSGSQDNKICLWSVSSGAQLCEFSGHSEMIFSLKFSPDGSLICSGSEDHTVRIWEWTDMISTTHQTRSNASLIPWTSFRRRHDESEKPGSRIWNESIGMYSSSSGFNLSAVAAVAFSGDGTILATGSWNGTVCLWDTSTGIQIRTLSSREFFIKFITFSPSGKQLSVAGDMLHVWDVKTGRCDRVLEGHTKGIWMVVYAHDEHMLLSCSEDKSLRIWDTMAKGKAGRSSGKVLYHDDMPIYAISVSPDKRLVLFGSSVSHNYKYPSVSDRPSRMKIRLLDMTKQAVLWTLQSTGIIQSLSFSSDGSRMLSATLDGHICLWDTALASSSEDRDALLEEFHAHSALEQVSFSIDQKNIISDASFHPIGFAEHWPHCASLDDKSSSASPPVYFLFDGWIWRAGPGGTTRICWVPRGYRHVRSKLVFSRETIAVSGNKIVFGTASGRVVLLDLSNCTDVF